MQREQKIDRGIYRDIMRSLKNEDCTPNTFHLKIKGITILAEEVTKSEKRESGLDEGSGYLHGAKRYQCVRM
jgi:hypothetical protein